MGTSGAGARGRRVAMPCDRRAAVSRPAGASRAALPADSSSARPNGATADDVTDAMVDAMMAIGRVAEEPALPPNWEAHEDDETGEIYFHNVLTDETQWEAPTH